MLPVRAQVLASLASAWPGVVPALAAALARAQGTAVDAVDAAAQAVLARALGVDLGWVLLDRSAYAPRVDRVPVQEWAGGVPAAVARAQAAGAAPADALAQALAPALEAAGSTAHRTGRLAVVDAATGTGGLVRWRRVASPGACGWCRALATRGAVYRTRASGAHAGHGHCRCHLEPVAGAAAVRRTVARGQVGWERIAGEVGDPFAAARARRTSPGTARAARARGPYPDAALYRPGARTPERLASVRLQISQYERSIPEIERVLAAGDATAAPGLAWQRDRLAVLRAEERSLAAGPGTGRRHAPVTGRPGSGGTGGTGKAGGTGAGGTGSGGSGSSITGGGSQGPLLPGEPFPGHLQRLMPPPDQMGRPRRAPLPTIAELEDEDRILPHKEWAHRSQAERDLVDWLAAHGLVVDPVEASTVEKVKSADSVDRARTTLIELKTPEAGTDNALYQALREARVKADHVVVDLRPTRVALDDAAVWLASTLRTCGASLREVTLVMADGRGRRWVRPAS